MSKQILHYQTFFRMHQIFGHKNTKQRHDQNTDNIKSKIVFKGVLCFPFTNHPYPFIWFPLLKNLLFPRPPGKKGYKYLWNYRSTISCNNKQRVYQTHIFHIDDGFKIVSKLKNILITIHVIHMFMKHGVSIT